MSERPCPVEGCEKTRARTRSTCEAHYYRMRKYGSYDLPVRSFAKDAPCQGPGCDRSANGHDGYCGTHRERVKRHGDPGVEKIIWGDDERRFWSHVDKTGDCWLWTGSLTYDGYSLFSAKKVRTGAHRWAWRLTHGEFPPKGMHLDHLCLVRHCVNPDHLEVVTRAENMRRALLCPSCRRQEFGERKGISA